MAKGALRGFDDLRERGLVAYRQVREGVISYGVSSYGYDMRVAPEFRIFTNVLSAIVDPKHFDDRSFDQFAGWFGAWPPEERVLVDARGCQWASPYGLVGLLTDALKDA